MSFQNDPIGGTTLVRPSIHSPNFVSGVSGWSVNYDGSAEFNNVIVRGSFEVDGIPQRRVKIYTDASGFAVIEFRDGAGNLYSMTGFDAEAALSIFAGTTSTLISELAFETGGRIRFGGATYGVVYDGGSNAGFLASNMPGNITESWHALSFANGWGNWGAPYGIGRYRLMPDGMVQFQGLIKGGVGVDGTTIFNLPAGYRPANQIIISTAGGTASKHVGMVITTGGAVQIFGVSAAPADGVSLDNCSFAVIA